MTEALATQRPALPPAPHAPALEAWDRQTEDYLDWVENQGRGRLGAGRVAAFFGLAAAATVALAAVVHLVTL
jgi:hypothetical protein